MQIASVQIKNLRAFADVTVPFNNYVCLVGPNGSGKSAILCALNVFFRETENAATDLSLLDREDFHNKNTNDPIEITITFDRLNSEAQKDFADYYRQGVLVVSAIATFNEATGKAEVKQYGQRLAMPAFKDFFRAVGDKKLVAELRGIYNIIRETYPDLPPPGTKDAMVEALQRYESTRPDQCELIPSEDQFYGVSKGSNRLGRYLQWVYVPAVKDAATEQVEARNSALGKLLSRTVRARTNFDESVKELRESVQAQYQVLLDNNQHILHDLSLSLKTRLAEWAHPEATLKLEWRQDPSRSVKVEEPFAHIIAGEGDFEGELARFGHGLQRSYLLVLLQELASSDDTHSPRLILGCEEPELYQHPPQARHLAAVLQKLSNANAQIVISTHSPFFVSGLGFEDVRMVRRLPIVRHSTVTFMTFNEISQQLASATGEQPIHSQGTLAKIHQALQPALSEMFFSSRLILVEGLEDVAYITAYMHLLEKWDEYRRTGCHIVPVNGKSELKQPIVIAKHMRIPTYVIFDADTDIPDKNGSAVKHQKDNKAILTLLNQPNEASMPTANVWGTGFVMWQSNMGSVVRDDIGASGWQGYQAEADKRYDHAGGLKKNSLHIGESLALAWAAGKRSAHLDRLCAEILDSANSVFLSESSSAPGLAKAEPAPWCVV